MYRSTRTLYLDYLAKMMPTEALVSLLTGTARGDNFLSAWQVAINGDARTGFVAEEYGSKQVWLTCCPNIWDCCAAAARVRARSSDDRRSNWRDSGVGECKQSRKYWTATYSAQCNGQQPALLGL